MNDTYRQFEVLAATNPDGAWNLAYKTGQQNPEPVKFVPMERFRETVLGMLRVPRKGRVPRG